MLFLLFAVARGDYLGTCLRERLGMAGPCGGGACPTKIHMNVELSLDAGCGMDPHTNDLYAKGIQEIVHLLDNEAYNAPHWLTVNTNYNLPMDNEGLLKGNVHSKSYLEAMGKRTTHYRELEKAGAAEHQAGAADQFDGDTSYGWNGNTEDVSRMGANSILELAREADKAKQKNEMNFGLNLFRCPSHHARSNWQTVNLRDPRPDDLEKGPTPEDLASEGPLGFCHLASIATAIEHLQEVAAKEGRDNPRFVIFDSDCHTSNAYEDYAHTRRDILLLNTVMQGTWPHDGVHGLKEQAGKFGTTLSLPYPDSAGDAEHAYMFDKFIMPMIRAHQPQVIFHAMGFDIVEGDEYCDKAKASVEYYRYMYHRFREEGIPVVANLEGGYNVTNVGNGIKAVLDAIAGQKVSAIQEPARREKKTYDELFKQVCDALTEKADQGSPLRAVCAEVSGKAAGPRARAQAHGTLAAHPRGGRKTKHTRQEDEDEVPTDHDPRNVAMLVDSQEDEVPAGQSAHRVTGAEQRTMGDEDGKTKKRRIK